MGVKKIRYYQGVGLLILLSIVFAGCGGGPGGDPDPKINFNMPPVYQDNDGNNYAIPSGKTVQFYSLPETASESINADRVFTGTTTTGSYRITCTLPDSLINQQRYFWAIVILDDASDFDLQGKTQEELNEAIENGEVLFGKSIDDFENSKSYTLNGGVDIDNFAFFGASGSGPVSIINFIVPDNYEDAGDSEYPIPKNKTITFYSITESITDIDDTFTSDHNFTGITGKNKFQYILPNLLLGRERYLVAVVTLKGAFELSGSTLLELQNAVKNGDVLFGQAKDLADPNNGNKLYTLSDGITIENFQFFGMGAPGTISFTIPTTYQDSNHNNHTIPSGKAVKFYSVLEFGDNINIDHTFTGGTTGSGAIECELPSSLFGKERYFAAVVILEGDFDLQGKTQTQVQAAMGSGQILFGQTRNSSDNNISYELVDGINIGSFIFYGASS